MTYVVTVWYNPKPHAAHSKDYKFNDEAQAQMFAHSLRQYGQPYELRRAS